MLIRVSKEELVHLIKEEIVAWGLVGGGANPHAFEFDPNTVDTKVLTERGYYDNRDAWIAGVRTARLFEFLDSIENRDM